MLSVFLTEELERHTASTDDAELVFFFCSAQDEKRNTGVAVLRGLVHQIVTKRPQLVKHALPYFETPERTQQTLSSLETLWIIFRKLVVDAELGTMLCVLDGLDECEESTLSALLPRIVSLLASEAPSTQSTFRLAIVSRDMSALQGCRRVRLDPDNHEKIVSDIELFVSTRVHELSRIEGFDDEFRASVQTALLERAKGTFLWVGYAMHELSRKHTRSEIWKALEDLPSGLPAIYSRMLLQIPTSQTEISRAILRWVALAVRPLQLEELAAATGVRPFTPQITIEQAARDAVALCGPLLKIQEQEVSLTHQSARDYLLRKERDNNAVLEEFRLREEPSHLELAQKCLDCIAQSSFQHKAIELRVKLDPQESPLLRYATLCWPDHARSCSTLAVELFSYDAPFFQKKSPLRNYWWDTYRRDTKGIFATSDQPLLHISCTLEIVPWVEAILAKKSWKPRYHKRVDEKNSRGGTTLHLAAERGNEALVRLLIDNRVDIKAKDDAGWTALHSAAKGGNKEVVRLLVEKGVDIKAKEDIYGETALHLAAERGNKEVVQLLVEKGADINAKDNNRWTVLHLAAEKGNEEVVRLLVEKGADIKAKEDIYRETALHLAAEGGNREVVQLLVEKGADVKAKDDNGRTALHLAAQGGNKEVVRLLVEKGADVNAKDKFGKTVLYSAAEGGNEEVVRLLVEKGADVNAKDNNGWTVLYLAAEGGNEEVVRLLVEKGADINTKDKYGKTVLQLVAKGGNKEVVRLLVEKGADVNAKDEHGKTVLHSAAKGGNKEVVRLLVEKGVDIKAKEDIYGETALHLAAKGGNKEVVQLLVEKKADVKAKDDNGRTVLHLAAQGGNKEVVRLLIEKGADVKAKDDDGRTVLQSRDGGG